MIPGYFWIFPLPNGEANVGLGMKTQAISDQKVNLKKEMLNLIENDPIFKERFKDAEPITPIQGYGLPLGSKKVPLSGEGFIICGDAGYLIEPLTGEGIGEALVSGRYAGWQAIECFEKNDFSAEFMYKYDETVYKKLWPDHSQRLKIRNLIEKYPGLFDLSLNLIQKIKPLKKMVVNALR